MEHLLFIDKILQFAWQNARTTATRYDQQSDESYVWFLSKVQCGVSVSMFRPITMIWVIIVGEKKINGRRRMANVAFVEILSKVDRTFCSVVSQDWSVLSGPRDHEDGGVYATGLIGRTYESGEMVNTTIDITANHFGYFEFRLCPLDMGESRRPRRLTQSCLDQHLLTIGPSDSKSNGDDTRYYLPHGNKSYFYVPVQLPPEIISCKHCVLQWKYHAGNTWGKDQKGRKCLGCSDQQEEFYNCADITIIERSPSELSTLSNLDNSTMPNHSGPFRPSSLSFLLLLYIVVVASFWLCTLAWNLSRENGERKTSRIPMTVRYCCFLKLVAVKTILLVEENHICLSTPSLDGLDRLNDRSDQFWLPLKCSNKISLIKFIFNFFFRPNRSNFRCSSHICVIVVLRFCW